MTSRQLLRVVFFPLLVLRERSSCLNGLLAMKPSAIYKDLGLRMKCEHNILPRGRS